jgi:hypothetical protein
MSQCLSIDENNSSLYKVCGTSIQFPILSRNLAFQNIYQSVARANSISPQILVSVTLYTLYANMLLELFKQRSKIVCFKH